MVIVLAITYSICKPQQFERFDEGTNCPSSPSPTPTPIPTSTPESSAPPSRRCEKNINIDSLNIFVISDEEPVLPSNVWF